MAKQSYPFFYNRSGVLPAIFFPPKKETLLTDKAGHGGILPATRQEQPDMTGEITIRQMQDADRDAVMRIFNYYAATGFAAFPDGPLPLPFFSFLQEGALSAIVLEKNGEIAGFGLLKPFLPFSVFRRTGMLTYFLAPDSTGRGLGTRLLGRMTDDAKTAGLKVLVATMSSKNEAGIRFHTRNGFFMAGNLDGVGEKFGEPFGVVWMQRPVE